MMKIFLNPYFLLSLYQYVNKVFENIYKVQSANSFKIAEKIDLKDDGNGYDLKLFWHMYWDKLYSKEL